MENDVSYFNLYIYHKFRLFSKTKYLLFIIHMQYLSNDNFHHFLCIGHSIIKLLQNSTYIVIFML